MNFFVKECTVSKSTGGKEYLSLLLVDSEMTESRCYLWECNMPLMWHVLAMSSLPQPNAKGFIGFKWDYVEADLGVLSASASLQSEYPQWVALLPQIPTFERFKGAVEFLLAPWSLREGDDVDISSLSARQRVVCRVLSELPQLYEAYKGAYGGRKQHHAYKGGLLQHTFEVLCFAAGLRKWFPWDVDMFVLGLSILYHDYGKIHEYEDETAAYTEQLVLWPHPVASAYAFKDMYGDLLSEGLMQRILHCIISHNGRKEWGTAALPATIEAFVLSELDLMSAWGHTIVNSISMDYVTGMDRRVVTTPVPVE